MNNFLYPTELTRNFLFWCFVEFTFPVRKRQSPSALSKYSKKIIKKILYQTKLGVRILSEEVSCFCFAFILFLQWLHWFSGIIVETFLFLRLRIESNCLGTPTFPFALFSSSCLLCFHRIRIFKAPCYYWEIWEYFPKMNAFQVST